MVMLYDSRKLQQLLHEHKMTHEMTLYKVSGSFNEVVERFQTLAWSQRLNICPDGSIVLATHKAFHEICNVLLNDGIQLGKGHVLVCNIYKQEFEDTMNAKKEGVQHWSHAEYQRKVRCVNQKLPQRDPNYEKKKKNGATTSKRKQNCNFALISMQL